jgi:AcrR family transcriptional regulator
MQEIANAANINKGLLHYYFKSKDALFGKVFGLAFEAMMKRFADILSADTDLPTKIEQFCHTYIMVVSRNSYLPRFVINEISRQPDAFIARLRKRGEIPNGQLFFDQVKREVEAGNIRPIDGKQLLVNMLSLCIFPFLAKPMIQILAGLSAAEFKAFIEARKTEVSKFVLDAILIERQENPRESHPR